MITPYRFYRLALLALTLLSVGNLGLQFYRYQQQYQRIPTPLRTHLEKNGQKGGEFMIEQLLKQKRDLLINGGLLFILILLNAWIVMSH